MESITTVDEALKVIGNLQIELKKSREEQKALKDQQVRLMADFENFQKRKKKELADNVRFRQSGVNP